VTLRLRYELTGKGWANCTIDVDGQRARTTASYLSDALDELCRAALDMLRDQPHAEAIFEEEPGEYRWIFDGTENQRLRIRIVDGVMTSQNPTSTVVLDAECTTREFGEAILFELQRLLEFHGEQGYLEEWVRFPFPRSRLKDLKRILDADR
jgi:hypothetical protein